MYFFVAFAVLLVSSTCNAQSARVDDRSAVCKVRNAYVSVDGKCDSYVECREYQAIDMECPDGLNFNPNAPWPSYPCGYPQDVPCAGRRTLRLPQPSADCERQYGYFKSSLFSENDCGHYRLCNAGQAFDMLCATGLAFNPVTARCDWPELVPSCNAEKYIGFKCPPVSVNEAGEPVVTNHKYENNCYAFYSCINGHARILSCDDGFAFNSVTGRCEDADRVQCGTRATSSRAVEKL